MLCWAPYASLKVKVQSANTFHIPKVCGRWTYFESLIIFVILCPWCQSLSRSFKLILMSHPGSNCVITAEFPDPPDPSFLKQRWASRATWGLPGEGLWVTCMVSGVPFYRETKWDKMRHKEFDVTSWNKFGKNWNFDWMKMIERYSKSQRILKGKRRHNEFTNSIRLQCEVKSTEMEKLPVPEPPTHPVSWCATWKRRG